VNEYTNNLPLLKDAFSDKYLRSYTAGKDPVVWLAGEIRPPHLQPTWSA